MKNVIELDRVVKKFKSITVVDQISLQINENEVMGLLGPNGAGKTTTINLINGLLKPNSGNIRVMGLDPQKQMQEVRRYIGLVPQETNVYTDLNSVENMMFHAALYCKDLRGIEDKVESLLKLMLLWERRKDPVRTFSGGMKRRLVLARALLHDPQVILFDEPTLGVDVQGKHVLWQHIKSLVKENKSFIVSTNNMEEADVLCDRIAIIDHGKVIAVDTPENLKSQLGGDIITLVTEPLLQNPREVFPEFEAGKYKLMENGEFRLELRDAEKRIGEIVARVQENYRIKNLSITRPTLDDVFLYLTGKALRE